MADETHKIKCVILTMRRENILLPNANVAEIVSVNDTQLKKSGPAWFLGTMQWRGKSIPLVSFEAAGGEKVTGVNLNTQAIVLRTVGKNGDNSIPFIGLVMSGVPHITYFKRNQIISDEAEVDGHPMIAQKVRINGARVSILDLDAMIDMVSQLSAGEGTESEYTAADRN